MSLDMLCSKGTGNVTMLVPFSKKHKKHTKSKFLFVVTAQHTAAAHNKHGQNNAGQAFPVKQDTPQCQ